MKHNLNKYILPIVPICVRWIISYVANLFLFQHDDNTAAHGQAANYNLCNSRVVNFRIGLLVEPDSFNSQDVQSNDNFSSFGF